MMRQAGKTQQAAGVVLCTFVCVVGEGWGKGGWDFPIKLYIRIHVNLYIFEE